MEGLLVTPTTCWFFMRSARLPVSRRSRERSSSQIDTPASESCCKRSVMRSLLVVPRGSDGPDASASDAPDAVLGRRGDRFGGDAELCVDTGVVGGRAVVVDRD